MQTRCGRPGATQTAGMGRLPALALLLGMFAVATAPPLILLAHVPPFALAAWRLLVVGALLLPFAGKPLWRDWRGLRGGERGWLVFSGLLYGFHFGLFNLAFEHTSKESVVVLLGAQPLMAAAITFSKIFGLAGLRLGYGVAQPELIAALEKVRQPFNINSIAQAGALAALGDTEHLARTRANNRAGIEFFQLAFRQQNWEFIPSHANFILLRAGNGQAVFESLQRDGIITRPMAGYGLPEWIRISIGTATENSRCLDALRRALKSS
jgi:hypothetical protein